MVHAGVQVEYKPEVFFHTLLSATFSQIMSTYAVTHSAPILTLNVFPLLGQGKLRRQLLLTLDEPFVFTGKLTSSTREASF